MLKIATVRVLAHVSDTFHGQLKDENGNTLAQEDGYVPHWMAGASGSDDFVLEIDNATGRILNWTPIPDSVLDDYNGDDEEF